MTPEALWNRYAAIWSLDDAARGAELAACVADDVSYCDPNGLVVGQSALSDHMRGFQRSLPGASFRIASVLHHHDRTLAHWTLHGADGRVVLTGTSFAALSDSGRLRTITGFFSPSPAGAAA